jgi:hypothetical protein
MHMSRLVVGGAVAAVFSSLVPEPAAAQRAAPRLSRDQRATLESVIATVERAGADPALVTAAAWQVHVLRAADGSHYVATRALLPHHIAPKAPVMLYVRLSPHRAETVASATAPRSAVMEWLRGLRGDPLPMSAARSTTVNPGEMPVGGTASAVGDVTADSSAALRLMALQQERQARLKEERDARRRAELESAANRRETETFPFEDFDLTAQLDAIAPTGTEVRRGFTAGPGRYTLHVAWATPDAPGPPRVTVVSHLVSLPVASADFGVSDVIVASAVTPLEAPPGPEGATTRPYAMGALDVTPANGNDLRVDGTLGLVYQIINPGGLGTTGKPDVEVRFDVSRVLGDRVAPFATLQAQRHDGAGLPADFDLAKGHPLLGAVRAPLASFPRGTYRVVVTATDRVRGQRATSEASFEVHGTPASLLREAPSLGTAFRRDAVLLPSVLAAVARAIAPPAPSPALAGALAATAAGHFTELLRDLPVSTGERPVAVFLRGLGLYGLGDSVRSVASQLQQAASQGAPAPAVQLLIGATAALGGDDRAAITAWNQAREGGIDDGAVAPLLVDAYMRQGDLARAEAMARAGLDSRPATGASVLRLAAISIATARYAEAVALLDGEAAARVDEDAAFLRLHALYGMMVRGRRGEATPEMAARFRALARAYLEANGRHVELIGQWLAVLGDQAAVR